MSVNDILGTIHHLNTTSGFEEPIRYYLNGGCHIFAKKLQKIVGGDVFYLLDEYHFILCIGDKYFDASGNVTSKYIYSRMISEVEFLSRKKLVRDMKMFIS